MSKRVAIVGIGYAGFRTTSSDISYREMIFEAATKCYEDAGGIHPHDIDSFVASSEDFMEGISIADEYVPDQLGAVLKPVQSIAGDSLQGLASAVMQIKTGKLNVVATSAFSKVSNLSHYENVEAYATDPVYVRPFQEHPAYLAGLEMNRYLYESGTTREQCAAVVVKNKYNALDNPRAAYGAKISIDDILGAPDLSSPLGIHDASGHLDGAVVLLLATEEKALRMTDKPIWIKGIGWGTDTPNLDSRLEGFGAAIYARLAAKQAYAMAGITAPYSELDIAEVDDTFSYKQLQHLEALNICGPGEAGKLLELGCFDAAGDLPVNISGGSLGVGYLHEANGLHRVLETALQLRGEAGKKQLPDVETGLAFAWRGIPTATGTAVILGRRP
ncbi:MAG: acetyl-CoA acetyltransferase [Bacillota bacterium]|nr:acetyl-CoA acetyltransferase [Bacillota bacterium]